MYGNAKGLPVQCFGWEIHPDPWNTRNKIIGYIDRISEFYSNLYYLHIEKKADLGETPYVFSNSARMVSDRSLRKQWKLLEPIGVARCFIDQLVWVTKMAAYGAKRLVVGVVLCVFGGFGGCFIWSFFCFLKHRWVVDLEMVQNWSRSFFEHKRRWWMKTLALAGGARLFFFW